MTFCGGCESHVCGRQPGHHAVATTICARLCGLVPSFLQLNAAYHLGLSRNLLEVHKVPRHNLPARWDRGLGADGLDIVLGWLVYVLRLVQLILELAQSLRQLPQVSCTGRSATYPRHPRIISSICQTGKQCDLLRGATQSVTRACLGAPIHLWQCRYYEGPNLWRMMDESWVSLRARTPLS